MLLVKIHLSSSLLTIVGTLWLFHLEEPNSNFSIWALVSLAKQRLWETAKKINRLKEPLATCSKDKTFLFNFFLCLRLRGNIFFALIDHCQDFFFNSLIFSWKITLTKTFKESRYSCFFKRLAASVVNITSNTCIHLTSLILLKHITKKNKTFVNEQTVQLSCDLKTFGIKL